MKVKVHREKIYSYNLGLDSWGRRILCGIKKKVRSLCIKFINKALSSSLPWMQAKFEPNYVKFCVLLLISFNISSCVLDVIDLMACLRSSVEISVSPNYWYHNKYGISDYARNNWYQSISIQFQLLVSELMVFDQD